MGWIRKQILKIVEREIRENGIQVGGYLITEEDNALTIRKV